MNSCSIADSMCQRIMRPHKCAKADLLLGTGTSSFELVVVCMYTMKNGWFLPPETKIRWKPNTASVLQVTTRDGGWEKGCSASEEKTRLFRFAWKKRPLNSSRGTFVPTSVQKQKWRVLYADSFPNIAKDMQFKVCRRDFYSVKVKIFIHILKQVPLHGR